MSLQSTLEAADAFPETGTRLYAEIMGPMASPLTWFVGTARLDAYRFRQLWADDASGFERYRERVDGIHRRLALVLERRS